jgi:hypothetical protein
LEVFGDPGGSTTARFDTETLSRADAGPIFADGTSPADWIIVATVG